MRLLGTNTSPFVRKVRIVLEEKGIPYAFVIAKSSMPNSPVPAHNPLGKIPVLLRDDGTALYDSPVIAEYLDGLFPEPRLIAEEFENRIAIKRWEALGDGVAEATVAISHDYRKPRERWESPEWHQRHRLKIERGLAVMAHDLGSREFCHGNRFSLADVATGYALGYLDFILKEIDWRSAHPNLQRFAERMGERRSFARTAHAA